jgi:hypothetical protein
MTAAELLDDLDSRGITVIAVGNRLRWHPREALDTAEVEALRQHKPELLGLLRGTLAEAEADEMQGRYWWPPPGTPLFFQDSAGRPRSRGEARMWTYTGAPSWYFANVYPPP